MLVASVWNNLQFKHVHLSKTNYTSRKQVSFMSNNIVIMLVNIIRTTSMQQVHTVESFRQVLHIRADNL